MEPEEWDDAAPAATATVQPKKPSPAPAAAAATPAPAAPAAQQVRTKAMNRDQAHLPFRGRCDAERTITASFFSLLL